jgi:hypothetical protein
MGRVAEAASHLDATLIAEALRVVAPSLSSGLLSRLPSLPAPAAGIDAWLAWFEGAANDPHLRDDLARALQARLPRPSTAWAGRAARMLAGPVSTWMINRTVGDGSLEARAADLARRGASRVSERAAAHVLHALDSWRPAASPADGTASAGGT